MLLLESKNKKWFYALVKISITSKRYYCFETQVLRDSVPFLHISILIEYTLSAVVGLDGVMKAGILFFHRLLVTVITFYSPRCRGQETAKESFRFSSQAATCLPHTVEAAYCLYNAERQTRETVNASFYSVWFDPTGNQTRVNRFGPYVLLTGCI